MGQALYRQYRPRRLSEVVGQEHITRTLQNALEKGVISHAYLFTGPRGVGKTSVARILAYQVNGIPYDDDGSHMDIIEIDAASNRRIDEIRELRERIHVSPALAKYKVYIIDEVHMLTKEAFNALLKTLEEPPKHAIFILATTEAHKLPETIISRTQRFTFKPVPDGLIAAQLKYIAEKEKLEIEAKALDLLAQHGSGSFRDSISFLDQARGLGSIDESSVRLMLGVAPEESIMALFDSLKTNTQKIQEQLAGLKLQGYPAASVAKQLSEKIRIHLKNAPNSQKAKFITILRALIDVPASHDPDTLLEIILLEHILHDDTPSDETKNTNGANSARTAYPNLKKQAANESNAIKARAETSRNKENQPKASKPAIKSGIDEDTWVKILLAAKGKHNTLYSIMRMAEPMLNGDKFVLEFQFAFHQKRLNEPKNKQIIEDVLANIFGRSIKLECLVIPGNKATRKKNDTQDSLKSISNIFGSAEVIE